MRSFALARNEIIPHIVDIQDFFAFICVALRNKKRGHFDLFGAENGTRTRDLNLGKVALYQLSYFRMACFAIASAKVNKKSETPNFFCRFCGFFIAKPA